MISRLLIFDLKGKIAHFRKFYTSSSSLSYAFPPRTTIIGIIAGILGRGRDTYYEEFNANSCKIAISIKSSIRKMIQTVNYIRTKEEDGYTTAKGVIKRFIERKIAKYPTPVELVIPKDLTEEIIYRIYFWHQEDGVMNGLGLKLRERKSIYPIYFGGSEFLADAELIDEVTGASIKESFSKQPIEICSVLREDYIEELLFEEADTLLQYISEKMPVEFGSGRSVKRNEDFIYEKNQKIIKARLKIPYMELIYKEKKGGTNIKENIAFMEW